jgi:LCP family protein required for cell wall assembly
VLLAVALVASCSRDRKAQFVIGKVSPAPSVIATPEPQPGPPEVPAPQLAPQPGRPRPNGTGPRAAVDFRGAVNVPGDLLFFLVIGSDARPGQDITRTRADSLHVAAVDPLTKRGTVLGLPRDSYVDVPGHGKQKINAALALGGPELTVRTVRNLTGFPISYYAVTGFEGMVAMVDELGGLDVQVEQRMHDPEGSGADFEPGWYHMDGRQVLAFSRDRHDFSDGDLTRSRNQGKVILHTLDKLRAETSDEDGIRHWLGILYRHGRLDMSMQDAVRLGSLARTLVPSAFVNVVAPGSGRTVNGQSVVVLDEQAYALFRDVGADAVADGRTERPTPTPTAPPTPTPAPSVGVPTPTPVGATPTPLVHIP